MKRIVYLFVALLMMATADAQTVFIRINPSFHLDEEALRLMVQVIKNF